MRLRDNHAVAENRGEGEALRQIFPVGDGADQWAYPGPADPLRTVEPITPKTPGVDGLIARLADVYAYPAGTCVRANMVVSVDGAIAVDGRSGGLSGVADRLIFMVLRSLADVIVVGAGTARAEKYGPAKPSSLWPQLREGRPAVPPIAVVTRSLGLDLDSQLVRGDGGPRTILLTTSQAPAQRRAQAARTADVIVAGNDNVSAAAAIEQLTGLGYHRILVEGGPTLLGELVGAGLLDELCVTTSPVLEGGHSPARMLAGQPGAMPLRLVSMLEDDDFVLARYARGR
jgi:riboflavin biosynthesis pyrimidine reductase